VKRNMALLFIVVVSLFVAVQPASAEEHGSQDISQKIEKLSQACWTVSIVCGHESVSNSTSHW